VLVVVPRPVVTGSGDHAVHSRPRKRDASWIYITACICQCEMRMLFSVTGRRDVSRRTGSGFVGGNWLIEVRDVFGLWPRCSYWRSAFSCGNVLGWRTSIFYRGAIQNFGRMMPRTRVRPSGIRAVAGFDVLDSRRRGWSRQPGEVASADTTRERACHPIGLTLANNRGIPHWIVEQFQYPGYHSDSFSSREKINSTHHDPKGFH